MRLPDDAVRSALALGLTAALAGCSALGGDERPTLATAPATSVTTDQGRSLGPAGDYPVVLGEPFVIDGKEYTPSDALNYDEVGFASVDSEGGSGITAAHKTLPLPSYAEVTSLETGRTILVRVERRGPMTNARLIALSPGARQQLGASDGTPVRVRRVNPPETQRAELRAGREAPLRMDTPATLIGVLRRKLPENGSASLANAAPAPPVANQDGGALTGEKSYALAPLAKATNAKETPGRNADVAAKTHANPGDFVVQAATFASEANARRAADSLHGFVDPAGRYYRVRMGPFASRGQAEAALAKVRAAGYSDAKVSTEG